jgi:hypothetical protein
LRDETGIAPLVEEQVLEAVQVVVRRRRDGQEEKREVDRASAASP